MHSAVLDLFKGTAQGSEEMKIRGQDHGLSSCFALAFSKWKGDWSSFVLGGAGGREQQAWHKRHPESICCSPQLICIGRITDGLALCALPYMEHSPYAVYRLPT